MDYPTCPRCGCPPRSMTVARRVSVDVGVLGRGGILVEHGAYRVGKIVSDTADYRCAAGHRWTGPVVTANQRKPIGI